MRARKATAAGPELLTDEELRALKGICAEAPS